MVPQMSHLTSHLRGPNSIPYSCSGPFSLVSLLLLLYFTPSSNQSRPISNLLPFQSKPMLPTLTSHVLFDPVPPFSCRVFNTSLFPLPLFLPLPVFTFVPCNSSGLLGHTQVHPVCPFLDPLLLLTPLFFLAGCPFLIPLLTGSYSFAPSISR